MRLSFLALTISGLLLAGCNDAPTTAESNTATEPTTATEVTKAAAAQ